VLPNHPKPPLLPSHQRTPLPRATASGVPWKPSLRVVAPPRSRRWCSLPSISRTKQRRVIPSSRIPARLPPPCRSRLSLQEGVRSCGGVCAHICRDQRCRTHRLIARCDELRAEGRAVCGVRPAQRGAARSHTLAATLGCPRAMGYSRYHGAVGVLTLRDAGGPKRTGRPWPAMGFPFRGGCPHAVQCGAVRCSAVQGSAVQGSAVQGSAVQCLPTQLACRHAPAMALLGAPPRPMNSE
jgi:hypothetical protein